MIEFRLSKEVDPIYYPVYTTTKENIFLGGSKGSGKSYAAALKVITDIIANPNLNYLVIRKVYGTMRDSCYTDLLAAIAHFGMQDRWERTVSPLQLTYNNGKTKQTILFRGLDDPLKLASIRVEYGYLAKVWFEEAFEITNYEDILKVQGSIRAIPEDSGLLKQFIYTFNPWSAQHWLKEQYFDKVENGERTDSLCIISTYLNNPAITAKDRLWYDNLRRINPRAAEVICDGKWGRAQGLIYENWTVVDFDKDEVMEDDNVVPAFGLDFGFKVSYNAFACALVNPKEKKLWIYDEMYNRGMTNPDIAKAICDMGYGKEYIVADSAEGKSVAELKAGFEIKRLDENGEPVMTKDMNGNDIFVYDHYELPNIDEAMKGPDSVRNGISRVQEYEIFIHPKCKGAIADFSAYAWKVDKDGKETGDPEKVSDHMPDAIRYLLEPFYAKAHVKVASIKAHVGGTVKKHAEVFLKPEEEQKRTSASRTRIAGISYNHHKGFNY